MKVQATGLIQNHRRLQSDLLSRSAQFMKLMETMECRGGTKITFVRYLMLISVLTPVGMSLMLAIGWSSSTSTIM